MNSMFFSFKKTIYNTLLCPDIFKIKVSLASSTTFILLLVKDSVIETFGPLVSLKFFLLEKTVLLLIIDLPTNFMIINLVVFFRAVGGKHQFQLHLKGSSNLELILLTTYCSNSVLLIVLSIEFPCNIKAI